MLQTCEISLVNFENHNLLLSSFVQFKEDRLSTFEKEEHRVLISIASGKGGTGKTALALLLAIVHGPITLLDCDVEEPNCHLFLNPEWQNPSQKVTVTIPYVNLPLCNRCGVCATACLFNALVVSTESILLFDELCHSCHGCILACPKGAITEESKVIGNLIQGVSKNHPHITLVNGTLKVGTPSAVPLIKKMRKDYARPIGDILLDCPPGTACSMVAAVKDNDFCILVAEPNPFGKHDLELAMKITQMLNVPTGVVINKGDSGIGDQSIKALCENRNIPILGIIPHSLSFAKQYATGQIPDEFKHIACTIWENLAKQRSLVQ
jgi:MinD superfamily P-loop ATPase